MASEDGSSRGRACKSASTSSPADDTIIVKLRRAVSPTRRSPVGRLFVARFEP